MCSPKLVLWGLLVAAEGPQVQACWSWVWSQILWGSHAGSTPYWMRNFYKVAFLGSTFFICGRQQ